MLLVRLHWHNAFQQAPYREARLLAFADTPNKPSTQEDEEATNKQTADGILSLNAKETIEFQQNQVRDAVQFTIQTNANLPEGTLVVQPVPMQQSIVQKTLQVTADAQTTEKDLNSAAKDEIKIERTAELQDSATNNAGIAYLPDSPLTTEAWTVSRDHEPHNRPANDLHSVANDVTVSMRGHVQDGTEIETQNPTKKLQNTAPEKSKTAEENIEKIGIPQIAEAFETMRIQLESIHAMRTNKDFMDAVRKMLTAKELEQLEKTFHLVDAQKERLLILEDYAQHFNEWLGGKTSPKAFRSFLERFAQDRDDRSNILTAFDGAINNPEFNKDVAQWDAGTLEQKNQSRKIEIARAVWIAMNGKRLEDELDVYVRYWVNNIEKIEEAMRTSKEKAEQEMRKNKRIEDVHVADEHEMSLMQRLAYWRTNGIFGIGIYTPKEIYLATKRVWKAYEEASEDFTKGQSNKLASEIGSVLKDAHLPFGEAIDVELKHVLESEFNKAKSSAMEDMKNDNFKTLYRKFHEFKREPAKVIAVMEMAATHGYLFDLADLELVDEKKEYLEIFGVPYKELVPPHWDKAKVSNYISGLTRSNNSGAKDERQKGYDRLKEQKDSKVFKRRFEDALKSHNYWSAVGIAEVFIDRGKTGEVSEYLTLAMINHLRTNEEARKYITGPLLEQFGIMGNKWGTANFATNMITMNLQEVLNLKKDPNVMEGTLLETIDTIEKDILAASGKTTNRNKLSADERKDLIEKSADILAGKTVKVGDSYISLFDEKYRNYWDDKKNILFSTFEGTEASKTQMDYFGTESPIILLPTQSIAELLRTGSSGHLDQPKKAQRLIGAWMQRYSNLLEKGNIEAAHAFRAMMQPRIAEALKATFTEKAPRQLIDLDWEWPEYLGEPMFGALVARGFVTTQILRQRASKIIKNRDEVEAFIAEVEQQARAIQAQNPEGKIIKDPDAVQVKPVAGSSQSTSHFGIAA